QVIGGLRGHKLHRRALDRLGNRLRIAEVVLLALRVGAHVLRRHQPGIVTKRPQPATEVMRPDTGLHADQTGRHIGKPCFHLAPRPLLPQHDCATLIETDDVERVLADIDTDHGNHTVELLSHGRAPFIEGLLPAYLLTELEHGRTIPLAEVGAIDTRTWHQYNLGSTASSEGNGREMAEERT